MRSAVRETAKGPYLVLSDGQSEALLSKMRHIHSNVVRAQIKPVILASMDIRRFVRGFLTRNGIDLAVLSYQDLASDFTIQPVGSITLAAAKDDDAPSEELSNTLLAPDSQAQQSI